MTEIYVTKYALSSGPFKTSGEVKDGGSYAVYFANGYTALAHGKDFHLTKEAALADCERRRQKKLASIEKQRQRLEKMEFKL
ncbi:hypothetical protein JHU04_002480 [Brenneria sp. 4F2]|nr:hypothetical protein [Brenneria bubanii]